MKKCRAAAEVTQNKERFFDGLIFISGEENIVEPEEEPVHHLPERPDDVEQDQKYQSFFGEAGWSVF